MAINKRLRYFRTEEEYQEFYEQQRQACDDGTLELLETTVCCITHGDTDTPDEYLPSHEPGDENVIMHYNANDDIRYIPFINPMWTTRKIYIENATPINALKAMVTLPDVIDGNQLTTIPSDFVKYLNNFPKFNTKNITTFYYTSEQKFNITSEWPSLISFSVARFNGFHSSNIPIFDNNVLNAPNLQSIGYDTWLSINDFPVLVSKDIQILTGSFTDPVIDINSKLAFTENLTTLVISSSFNGVTYPTRKTHTVRLSYNGSKLSFRYISLCGSNNNRIVNFDITGNTQNITIPSLGLYDCDLSLSTIADLTINSQSSNSVVYLVDCDASASTLQSVTGWLSAENGKAKLTNFTDVTFLRCSFNEYIVELNDSIIRSGKLYITQDNETPANVVYNISGVSSKSIGFNGSGINNLTINTESYDSVSELNISGSIKKLIIPSGIMVAYSISVPSTVESINTLVDWYIQSPYGAHPERHTSTSNVLNFFKLHSRGLDLKILDSLNTLRFSIDRKYASQSSYQYGELHLTINADISAYDISFPTDEDGVDYINVLEVSFDKVVSIQTVINILTSIDPVFSVYQSVPNTSTLTIYDTQYNVIEQDYPLIYAIIRKFKTIDVVTVQ